MGSLKKLHGWYVTGEEWLPIKVDADGKVVLSPESSGLIPQYLIAKWDYTYGAIPAGWSLYESGGYSADLLTGGTPSADSVAVAGFEADKACDNNAGTGWGSNNAGFPHWWEYDFGSGITYSITKLTLLASAQGGQAALKDFILQGSNDNIDWNTVYTGQQANNLNIQTYTFDNSIEYRYYKINVTSTWYTSNNVIVIGEVEMMKLLASEIIKD